MKPIILLTDFGHQDGFVGIMKGVISAVNPQAQVIDLSHGIPPQNIDVARFVLWNSYKYFPKGSIFVCVVDPGVGSNRKILAIETRDHQFIVPDNGLLDLIIGEHKFFRIHEVSNQQYMRREISSTFHGRDIFAPVAAFLSTGIDLSELGKKTTYKTSQSPIISIEKSGSYSGTIIHVDHFGNLMTSFQPKVAVNGHLFIQNKEISIYPSYSAVAEGELLALIGSHGLLEIAIRNGHAANQLNLSFGAPVDFLFSPS